MSAELTVSIQEFNRVAERLIATSERTYPKFINGQALRVVSFAVKLTGKANAEKIQRQLGTLKTESEVGKFYKNGKRTASGFIRLKKTDWHRMELTLAARIINARRKHAGEPMLWGKALAESARKMTAARARSVAFIKSGWIPAIQALVSVTPYKDKTVSTSADGARIKGVPKGYAKPARFTISSTVTCEVGNTALLAVGKFSAGNPMPIAEKGLRAAMDLTTRDMADEFYKRMAIDLKPFGGRLGP